MTTPPRIGAPYVTPAGEKFDRLCAKVIAEFGAGSIQYGAAAMKEKLAALREFNSANRKILSDKIDEAMAKAKIVYPKAHEAADHQIQEVDGIAEELEALEDEANQAMGGNRPPKDGSSSSGQSSGA